MQQTIILCPCPGMGHIISMVELGKLIIHHYRNHFSITILLISFEFDNPNITSYINTVSQAHPRISFRRFPRISVNINPPRSVLAMLFECIALHKPYIIDSLQEILKCSNICAFIIDMFCSSALSAAKQLKIPTYYFFTSGVACLGAFMYIPSIHDQYTRSLKELEGTVINFPCIPPLKAIHMPEPFLDRNSPVYDFMISFCSCLLKADGIIVNTFDDLEPKPIKIIADGLCVPGAPTPPTYYIGPLIAESRSSEAQHECLSWLDEQPSKSVLFLCFGSRGSFSIEQVREMANGLEKSGHRFLWAVKNPPSDEQTKQTEDIGNVNLEDMLPEGFLNRVKERGMIVKSWAPQVAVLNHDSVGGFVTHCGWNSVLEAVVAGVPMIAWPLHAEQHLNRNVLVEDMKIAIAVEQREKDGFVSGAELERGVRELMDSDKGKELKEKCWRMKESSKAAWAECGSSIKSLGKLADIWMKI